MKKISFLSKKIFADKSSRKSKLSFYYQEADAQIKAKFLDTHQPYKARYEELFKYFLQGFISYLSPNGALVRYPGEKGNRGRRIDDLEGFSRFFPLAAAWLYGEKKTNVEICDQEINVAKLLSEGVISGTDPDNLEYWGDIEDYDQRIVEAADIALGLWISRDFIWQNFSQVNKNKVIAWLEQIIDKSVHNNNWLLFPVVTLMSLQGLGINKQDYDQVIKEKYIMFKQKHYIGQGWFNDPPKGIDYYNAWAVHYSLFWLSQIDSNFDSKFIKSTHAEFLGFYKYLFSEKGFPIMGRSICYRMAVPTPFITGTILAPEVISPGLALRALDLTWTFFVKREALKEGTVTQGYCEKDLSVINNYSGPGSCLWSLRSLIVAFFVSNEIPIWESSFEKLPVEISDFVVINKSIGWQIEGDNKSQHIKLKILKNRGKIKVIKKYGLVNKCVEFVFRRSFRPDNTDVLYNQSEYSTYSQVIKCKEG